MKSFNHPLLASSPPSPRLLGSLSPSRSHLQDKFKLSSTKDADAVDPASSSTSSSSSSSTLSPLRPSLLSILTREAKKEKLSYKTASVDAAARVFEAWSAGDAEFTELATTVSARLLKDEDDEEKQVNGNGGPMDHDGLHHHPKTKSPERVRFEEVALESLGRALPVVRPADASAAADKAREAIAILAGRMGEAHVWKIQLAALKGMLFVVRRKWVLGDDEEAAVTSAAAVTAAVKSHDVEEFLKLVIPPVCLNLTNKKYVAVRKCAVDILDEILASATCVGRFKTALAAARQPLAEMRTDVNVELQKKSASLLDLLS